LPLSSKYANAEVDLGAAAIRVEGFIQAKNRIAGGHFHRSKDRRAHGFSIGGEGCGAQVRGRWVIMRVARPEKWAGSAD
jgi:hypothetical protein